MFIKLYETEKYGQIAALKSTADDGTPTLEVKTDILEVFGSGITISLEYNHPDVEVAQRECNDALEAITEEKVLKAIDALVNGEIERLRNES